MPYDPMNQVHPGPTEPVDRIPADATQARTGNTEREQEMYAAGIEVGEANTKHNAAIRAAAMVPDGWKLVPERATQAMEDAWDMTPCNEDINAEFHAAYRAMLDAAPAAPGSPASAAPGDAQEPIKLVHLAVAARGAVRFITGRKLPDGIESCELYAMPDYGRAPAELYTAPAADDTPLRFTISASDRFELTGAVGLLRGYGCVGPAAALQRVLDAESASFSVQGEDDARDAGRYRAWRDAAVTNSTSFVRAMRDALPPEAREGRPRWPTAAEWDAGIDAAVAAQQGKGGGV